MKLDDLKKSIVKPHIVLVSGKLCSGKGTYCAQFPEYHHIATSSVVKQISGLNKRSELHGTGKLDKQIADELINQASQYPLVIIDGIRQQSIVQYIINHFGESNVELRWLNVPEEELRRRYQVRGDEKDDQQFDIAMKRDYDLGLGDVEAFIKSHPKGKIVNHF